MPIAEVVATCRSILNLQSDVEAVETALTTVKELLVDSGAVIDWEAAVRQLVLQHFATLGMLVPTYLPTYTCPSIAHALCVSPQASRKYANERAPIFAFVSDQSLCDSTLQGLCVTILRIWGSCTPKCQCRKVSTWLHAIAGAN